MRRVILALALVVGTPLIAACDSGTDNTASAPPAGAPASSFAAIPTSPAPDYAANTKVVCGKLRKIFNDDFAGFSSELGKMIVYKEEKQAPDAEKAEKAASRQLRTVASKIKKESGAAEDPEVQIAGAASAAKITKSAADAKLFDRVKTEKDLNRTIDTQMADWLNPVAGYCP